MTEQICLKMRINGQDEWYPIVPWGTRWYEADMQFEVLLEDADDIEMHIESLTGESDACGDDINGRAAKEKRLCIEASGQDGVPE